jgi:hypothetical protein
MLGVDDAYALELGFGVDYANYITTFKAESSNLNVRFYSLCNGIS